MQSFESCIFFKKPAFLSHENSTTMCKCGASFSTIFFTDQSFRGVQFSDHHLQQHRPKRLGTDHWSLTLPIIWIDIFLSFLRFLLEDCEFCGLFMEWQLCISNTRKTQEKSRKKHQKNTKIVLWLYRKENRRRDSKTLLGNYNKTVG